jgi:molybdenum cofactor guanylyltransferase
MNKRDNISGIVLAGGKSSRMGTDKGLMKFMDKPMISPVISAALAVTNEILIVSNNPSYKILGYKVVGDIIKDCGPMGGIYTGMIMSQTDYHLVLSCDIPFINPEILEKLKSQINGHYDAYIPLQNGKEHPLCGIYHRSCLKVFYKALLNGNFKMKDALKRLKVQYVDIDLDFWEMVLANINTKEEFYKMTNKKKGELQ